MKILGAFILLIGICIILMAGIAALQSQSDIGDTIVTENSSNYEEYQQVKDSSNLMMKIAGYTPYFLGMFVFIIIGVTMFGAIYLLKA